MKDEQYMALAIEQAKLAASLGEVPVGAVLVHQGEVIAAGYNRREIDKESGKTGCNPTIPIV